MVFVNDQNPFDVTPDDRRPNAAADDAPTPRDATTPPPAEDGVEPAAAEEAPATAEAAGDADAGGAALRTRRRHRRFAALGIAAAVIFTAGAGGGAVASLALARSTTATSADGGAGSQTQGGFGSQGGSQGFGGQGFGGQGFGSQGFGGRGGSGTQGGRGSTGGGTSTQGSTTATSAQVRGLVTIVSRLGYQSGEAAGTGIILTADGRILTNNHVIEGSTAIRVTDESTGRSYTAKVVGTDASKDVAVLQLEDASGLTPADLATAAPSVGDDVTAVGNANGTGTLSAAKGAVSALDQTITTSSEGSASGETLHGLIEISADVVSGDSGGAVENADGDVVGVTTAASSGSADVTGYAIPIGTALGVARQIVAGEDTDEITIGLPAFLGVSLDPDTDGRAVIAQVLPSTPAAGTDLAEGDVITAVDGKAITSRDGLSAAITQHAPGDRITIAYTDADGASRTATATLVAGPAD